MNTNAQIFRDGEDTGNTIAGTFELASSYLTLRTDGSYKRTYRLSSSDFEADIHLGDVLVAEGISLTITEAKKTESPADGLEVMLIEN